VDPATGTRVGKPLDVGQVEVQAVERVFERPAVELPSDALFGDALQLVGYDLQREGQTLHLTFHWQAKRRMEVAYKFFVHLVDTESGELVAQADVMPRDWTYPTTWWEKGEVVSDEIVLAVSDVPSGVYHLAIGVYHPETDTRLPVLDTARAGQAQDHLLLRERLVFH
jgi:signal recognition particle subunit SEC65